MIPVFPEILKQRRDQWEFSADQPWKPVAKDGADEEVKKAIEDFIIESVELRRE